MKTEVEIRQALVSVRASIQEEIDNGREGGDDWLEAATAEKWLTWVLED